MAEANVHPEDNEEVKAKDFLYLALYLLLGGVIVYFSWPVSPLFLASGLCWWLATKCSDRPLGKGVAGFLGPVTVGLGILALVSLLVNIVLFIFALDPSGFAVLADVVWRVEQLLRSVERLLGTWHSLGLWTFPAIALGLILLNGLLSKWRLVTRFLLAQRILSAMYLALTVATAFTFFGEPVIGDLVEDTVVERKIVASRYLEPVAQELASQAIATAVDQASDEDRRVYAGMFAEINMAVAREFPYLSLIEQRLSFEEVWPGVQQQIKRELDREFKTREYLRDGTTRSQRKTQLERESRQLLNHPMEYIESARELEAGLAQHLAEEQTVRGAESSTPFKRLLSSGGNQASPVDIGDPERKGYQYIAGQLLEGIVPGLGSVGDSINRIGETFLKKLVESYGRLFVDPLADETLRLRLRLTEQIINAPPVDHMKARFRLSLQRPEVAAAFLIVDVWRETPAGGDGETDQKYERIRETIRSELETAAARLNGGGTRSNRIDAFYGSRSTTLRQALLRGRPGMRARR